MLPEWNGYYRRREWLLQYYFQVSEFSFKTLFVYKMLGRTSVHGVTLAEKLPQKLLSITHPFLFTLFYTLYNVTNINYEYELKFVQLT